MLQEEPIDPATTCVAANIADFFIGAGVSFFLTQDSPLAILGGIALMFGLWLFVNWSARSMLPEIPKNFTRNLLLLTGAGGGITMFFLIFLANTYR